MINRKLIKNAINMNKKSCDISKMTVGGQHGYFVRGYIGKAREQLTEFITDHLDRPN